MVTIIKNLDHWSSYCCYCDSKIKFKLSQPYRDYTYRIEMHCINYKCEEQGITQIIEVKE